MQLKRVDMAITKSLYLQYCFPKPNIFPLAMFSFPKINFFWKEQYIFPQKCEILNL